MKKAVFDTKRHSNLGTKAEYRRISKYYKSLGKFKAEKSRRQRVLDLQNQGLTLKQIALILRVSERTVKRDLAKVMVYVQKRQTLLLRGESEVALEKFQAMSLKEQIRYVGELKEQKRRIHKVRRCSSLVITIDLDAVLSGYYAMSFKPKLPVDMLEYGRITIELVARGRKQALSRLYVGKAVGGCGCVNLQTNQSLNAITRFAFKGLQLVELADFVSDIP
jgi:hypothetical protein